MGQRNARLRVWRVFLASADAVHWLFRLRPVTPSLPPYIYAERVSKHIAHFSENFGFATLSPIFTGYLFSVAFGKTLDLHELTPELGEEGMGSSSGSRPSILHLPAERHRCLEGSACYAEAFTVTILACLVALALSVWMSWRDWRRMDSEEVEYAVDEGYDGGYRASSKPGSCRRTVESG